MQGEISFLELINNSWSLNKGNHEYLFLISIDFYDFNSPFTS